ncbi:MAG: hypothetical protein HQL51_16070 [Magnetococcales bacterium]|nr:hypothetical protein [Magnetococcales bacterium]
MEPHDRHRGGLSGGAGPRRGPGPSLLALSVVGTAVVWLVAWPLFRVLSQYFADVLG